MKFWKEQSVIIIHKKHLLSAYPDSILSTFVYTITVASYK